MKCRFTILKSCLLVAAIIIVLTEPESTLIGAKSGLDLCLNTVIPALLPLFVLSTLLTNSLSQSKVRILVPLGKLCKIPEGHEALLLLGFLCGYPVGAQNVYQTYSDGRINQETARRMLGFCSNAGPSFIFGVTPLLFTQRYIPWVLWSVQIISAILTGMLLPKISPVSNSIAHPSKISFQDALTMSLNALANVCGWVILFRTIISIAEKLLLFRFSNIIAVFIIGLLELTNGCMTLQGISSEAVRFVLCCTFLSFGGICVFMQTTSVVKELGIKSYIQGKLIQTSISILIALFLQPLLFSKEGNSELSNWKAQTIVLFICLCIIFICRKKEVAFSHKVMYNKRNAA